MTKRTNLKQLAKALKGVPARERKDFLSYYDELIEDFFEQGKSPREVFAELEPPEVVAENYLRDSAPENGSDEKQGYHVRRQPNANASFFVGFLAVLATIVLASLIVAFAASALGLALAGAYVVIISFGLLFSGHAVPFFAQVGMAVSVFALGMLFEVLTIVLAKSLAGMWRFVTGSDRKGTPMRKGLWRTVAVGGAMLFAGSIVFTASFGAANFDYHRLAVEEGLVVHEETIAISDEFTLQGDNFAVTVKKSEDETCKLVYRDFPENPKQYSFKDGKASLSDGKGAFSVVGASLGMQWRRGILIGAVSGDLQQAVLYLPASFSGKLCISIENGALDLADLTFSELTAETKNGSIDLEDIAAETVFAKVGNGSVVLKNVACARTRAEVSNGSVALERLQSDDIALTAGNGSVKGTVVGKVEDYSVTASCGLGSCNLQSREGGADRLEVRVGNGSVEMSFTE